MPPLPSPRGCRFAVVHHAELVAKPPTAAEHHLNTWRRFSPQSARGTLSSGALFHPRCGLCVPHARPPAAALHWPEASARRGTLACQCQVRLSFQPPTLGKALVTAEPQPRRCLCALARPPTPDQPRPCQAHTCWARRRQARQVALARPSVPPPRLSGHAASICGRRTRSRRPRGGGGGTARSPGSAPSTAGTG